MKTRVANARQVCCFLLFIGVGASNAQFAGGNGSGTDQVNSNNSSCSATGLNPFAGGSASGSASVIISSGACSPTPLNAFSGGSSSGFSSIVVSNSTCSSVPIECFYRGKLFWFCQYRSIK